MQYSWPGNVRELENVVKRFVILRDEALVLAELGRERLAVRVTAGRSTSRASELVPTAAAGVRRTGRSGRRAPILRAAPPAPLRSLPSLPGLRAGPSACRKSRAAAAMAAEREAIQQALDQLRWNRRKAAQLLGVSYKTLLNKMKECGITAPGRGVRRGVAAHVSLTTASFFTTNSGC